MNANSPAIVIQEVTKIFPRTWRTPPFEALKGISLSVADGESFGFIGANGAGKSTTIKILLDILRPTCGQVRVFGREVFDPLSRERLGYVPENPSLHDYLTPLEVLRMGLKLQRIELPDATAHCMHWLDRLGLTDVANKYIRGFSKGMVQRTAIAHALAIKPRLLILDEPLSGLDPLGRKQVVDILEEYRQAGGTLFFSSHVLYDVERLADRFGLIHNGTLLTIRSPQEIVADQTDCFVVLFQSDIVVPDAKPLRANRFEIVVNQHDLPARLAELENVGAKLLEIKPSVSLETVFLHTVGLRTAPPRQGL
jgi:ABC-2 type transport system ATP-binding protein